MFGRRVVAVRGFWFLIHLSSSLVFVGLGAAILAVDGPQSAFSFWCGVCVIAGTAPLLWSAIVGYAVVRKGDRVRLNGRWYAVHEVVELTSPDGYPRVRSVRADGSVIEQSLRGLPAGLGSTRFSRIALLLDLEPDGSSRRK